jgi:catechol-2,3-dioxygenase
MDPKPRNAMTTFPTINHVALTVHALEVSGPWYRALIGENPIIDDETDDGFHHIVWELAGGTLLGIHQHHRGAPQGTFSELQLGLDHVAFGCENRAALENWEARLDELGIEHDAIIDVPYGAVLSFRDPDNIALEFIAPPPR